MPSPSPSAALFPGVFSHKGLVELASVIPDIEIDCKYATADNFTGEPYYDRVLVLGQEVLAAKLVKAQEIFAADGYRLLVFDCYRPLSVQKKMYDATPDELKGFVANPAGNPRHCRGMAVDCSLVDADGGEVEMPSGFDALDSSSRVDYAGGTAEQRAMRDYFIGVMKKCGFLVNNSEWWHFYLTGDANGVLDVSFAEFETLRGSVT